MPLYEYECGQGHLTEHVCPVGDAPDALACTHVDGALDLGGDKPAVTVTPCDQLARRRFSLAAIHFKGGGFYANDYKGRYDRKRRPNPGDDLSIPAEAAITRAEGAEYDPPARMPETVKRASA